MHIVTKTLLSWLLDIRVGIARAEPLDGGISMTFGRAYRTIVFVFLLLATAMVAGAVVVFRGEPMPLSIGLSIAGALWLGILYAAYDAFCVRLTASQHGLQSRSFLTGTRMLPWERIQNVSYASYGHWYTFRSDRGSAIRVSIYRNGLRSFSALVAENIRRSPARFTPRDFYKHTA